MSLSWLKEFMFISDGEKIKCILCDKNIIKRKTNAERHFSSYHKEAAALNEEDKVKLFNEKVSKIKYISFINIILSFYFTTYFCLLPFIVYGYIFLKLKKKIIFN